jgi:hypothetical protein
VQVDRLQVVYSGVPSIQDCNLVMLQRLGSAEAALVGGALRLPAPSTQFLQVMADDMIALVGDGSDRCIWFSQTDVERQYAGAPAAERLTLGWPPASVIRQMKVA